MSNYGSYPGPPQEPWGRQPQEPYGQPSDPWGGQPDPWGGTPASTPPAGPTSPGGYPGYDQGGYDQGGYQQGGGGYDQGYEQGPGYGATRQYEQPGYSSMPSTEPVWGQPVAPPPRKGGSRTLIVVIVALALLVVAGGVAAMVKLGGSGEDPVTAPPTASQEATEPSGGADPSQDASTAPENSTDARFVKAGQCVVNEGSNDKPELKIVECGAKTFEVLARFDGTIDFETKCKDVQGYQFHYFFDSELNPLDFVLCLKQR
ncbi:flagellar basal body protein FliL [Phytohabitans sp. ZYX-F-186]|uniref:Flagellar basal body protein FliL n=1 Tax=Phytohabitans maris TaxID=3071409 RepID=A0ABU0ZJ53_9ACTN|nr:flagellar basal body protein FliL [Phytohabitans sp. ZYX-F-186]MDQ7907077.1 flagellar basal body protein FliL [Phytohabitans sp. ZYX-F-186]